jgi:hypothetical protein
MFSSSSEKLLDALNKTSEQSPLHPGHPPVDHYQTHEDNRFRILYVW